MNNEMNNSQAGATEQRTPKKLTFSVVPFCVKKITHIDSYVRAEREFGARCQHFCPAEQLAVTRFPP